MNSKSLELEMVVYVEKANARAGRDASVATERAAFAGHWSRQIGCCQPDKGILAGLGSPTVNLAALRAKVKSHYVQTKLEAKLSNEPGYLVRAHEVDAFDAR